MQTLSLFPQLLDFQMLGIFALRVTLGFIFVYFWYEKITKPHSEKIEFFEKLKLHPAKLYFIIVSYTEGILGVLLVFGLYTQGVAIVAGAMMLLASIIKWRKSVLLPQGTVAFYIVLSVFSFSLLFLGAGAFAIDLPL